MTSTLFRIFKNIDLATLLEQDKEELLRFFNITRDNQIRNHIAFIFSDLVYEPAVPFIFEKIHDKSISDNGSLVWALHPFDLKEYLLPLVKIAIE